LFTTPYDGPLGLWRANQGDAATRTDVSVTFEIDGIAMVSGRILGVAVNSPWEWTPGGPGRIEIRDPSTGRSFSAEQVGPHELLLRYPWENKTVQPVLLTRESPPLSIYPRKKP
jgi:hypothetical protein